MVDLFKVDNSPINQMALILGISVFGVLICTLILGELLQMLNKQNVNVKIISERFGHTPFKLC